MRVRSLLPLAWAAATPAAAQDVDPAPSAGRYEDGVWTVAGARADLEERRSYLAAYFVDIGGQDSRAIFLEGQAGLGGGAGLVGSYGYILARNARGGQARAQLARLGATYVRELGGVELDARLAGELLRPEGGAGVERARLRLRATVPLAGRPGATRLRAFVADELFAEARGITRNRINLGLRGETGPVALDAYWLREDRDDGRAIDALVVQTTLVLKPGR